MGGRGDGGREGERAGRARASVSSSRGGSILSARMIDGRTDGQADGIFHTRRTLAASHMNNLTLPCPRHSSLHVRVYGNGSKVVLDMLFTFTTLTVGGSIQSLMPQMMM